MWKESFFFLSQEFLHPTRHTSELWAKKAHCEKWKGESAGESARESAPTSAQSAQEQHKKKTKQTGNALLLIVQPSLHLFGTKFFPLRLPLCVFVGICSTVFWVTTLGRTEAEAPGVLVMGWEVCVLQLGALSLVCLSWAAGQAVIIQTGLWTGCCVVPMARVTSHTCTLSPCRV